LLYHPKKKPLPAFFPIPARLASLAGKQPPELAVHVIGVVDDVPRDLHPA
jgi:hypothetical protein